MKKEIIETALLTFILVMTIKNLFYFWDIWKICKQAERELELRNEQKRLLYERKAYKKLAETITKDD